MYPPASSTCSEREFKVAKNIQTDLRSKLLPKKLETQLFLKYNLRMLQYETDLRNPPDGFTPPNSRSYDVDPSQDFESDFEEE